MSSELMIEMKNVHKWLEGNLSSEEFKICMTKYPQWVQEN